MAELGQGHPRVYVSDRGGKEIFGEITDLVQVMWERTRDETSTAQIQVNPQDPAACDLLKNIRTVRHELVIFRGPDRVWEGPITRIEYGPNEVTLDGKDISWYSGKRVIDYSIDCRYPRISPMLEVVLTAMKHIFGASDGEKDGFNALQYLIAYKSADDAKTSAKIPKGTRTGHELLEQYAQRGGLDYVVFQRHLMLFDTNTQPSTLPDLDDTAFVGDLVVTEYGADVMTQMITTNNKGKIITVTAEQEFIDYYGRIESLHSEQWDGDGKQANEEAEVKKIMQRFIEQQKFSPVRINVPDNVVLRRDAPVTIQQLIPGAYAVIRANRVCRRTEELQKLQSVRMDWTPENAETIKVTFNSAPKKHLPVIGVLP